MKNAAIAPPDKIRLGYGPWLEINLGQLRQNLLAVISSLSPASKLIMIVKSDAYGHGITPVVEIAVEAGVTHFAVAYEEEAYQVRAAAPQAEILIMGITNASSVPILAEKRIMPAVISLEHAEALIPAAAHLTIPLRVHIKVDTGMGRLGLPPSEADALADKINQSPGMKVAGVFSHFATVDPARPVTAMDQVDQFTSMNLFQNESVMRHISSTRAVLFFPEWDFDAVRAGVSIYGYGTSGRKGRFKTFPVLQWKTTVMQVKTVPPDTPIGYYRAYQTIEESDIVTLKVGYADGYPRNLSNRGHVLVGGQRLRVVGRVSMNWITCLAPAASGIQAGDEAVLIGQQGDKAIWADELADTCKTIAYEIVTRIRPSLPRFYQPAHVK